MTAIAITDLSKTYKGKKRTSVAALKNLSLSVKTGEAFGFLGPNGAGKSTTIKVLTGQIRPTSGNARIFDISVSDPKSRRPVGYLPENPAFYDFMTAREYLRFVGRAFRMSRGDILAASDRVLALLQLQEAEGRAIRSFSKGMVQRLGMAQVLLHDPRVCILDEPMSGLDPMGRALVKDIIRELKSQGKTVFFSTHITSDVEAVCDRVGVIVDGCLRVVDSVENILRNGMQGYTVRVSHRDGSLEELTVEKHQLQERLSRVWAAGDTVERIEPRRRDLESFFVDVVAKAKQ